LDLPISQKYVEAVNEKSEYILYSSNWLNATVLVTDTVRVKELEALSFVDRVELVARGFVSNSTGRIRDDRYSSEANKFSPPISENARSLGTDEEVYDFQNSLIGIDKMHEEGFTGKGVTIAVFDAGFPGSET